MLIDNDFKFMFMEFLYVFIYGKNISICLSNSVTNFYWHVFFDKKFFAFSYNFCL